MMLMQLVRGVVLSLAVGSAFAAPVDDGLKASLDRIAAEARPGTLGIIVMDPATGKSIKVNDGREAELTNSVDDAANAGGQSGTLVVKGRG